MSILFCNELKEGVKIEIQKPLWDRIFLLGIIKGSIATEVNAGILSICEKFLKSSDKKWSTVSKVYLVAQLRRFMVDAKWAIRLLKKTEDETGSGDGDLLDFICTSYDKLCDELREYGVVVSRVSDKR